jgi:hypothetical protein
VSVDRGPERSAVTRIASPYEMRPPSIEQAFAAGDFVSPALEGSTGQWQHIAARGIIVDPLAGAEALAHFAGPQAAFYRAVCAWIGGDDAQAVRVLENLADPHAQNLLALIRQPRIHVLAQLPTSADGSVVLRDGIAGDRKFALHFVPGGAGDGASAQSGRALYDTAAPPNFFLCAMLEDHDVPLDIGAMPFPTIGCTSELEPRIATAAPWLRAFDYVIAGDHVRQRAEVERITGRSAFSYPLFHSLPNRQQPLETRMRDIDVFTSGALFSGFDPDAAKFVQGLLTKPNLALLALDGALPPDDHREALARSRITVCFSSIPGAIVPLAMDALSMGSIAVVPQGSAHRLWGGEADGVFTYDEAEGPVRTIERILADYPRYAAGCLANVGRLREAWHAETVASRLLRFSAVIAARPRLPRDPSRYLSLAHRRAYFLHESSRDWLAGHDADRHVESLAALDANTPAAHWHNEAARELLLVYGLAASEAAHPPAAGDLLARALDILASAVAAYPRDLILHFNYMRALYCFGDDDRRALGLDLAAEIAERSDDYWEIDPSGDLYPIEFNGDFVNTIDFCHLAALHAGGDIDARPRQRNIILASVFHLLAKHWERADYARMAVDRDPAFASYRLTLCELLVENRSTANLEPAREILVELARESRLAGPAQVLLRSLCDSGARRPALVDGLDSSFGQIERSVLLARHHQERLSSHFASCVQLRRGGGRGPIIRKKVSRAQEPVLSVILCSTAKHGCGEAVASLSEQSLMRDAYQIIAVLCSGEAPVRGVDAVVRYDRRQFMEFRPAALNQALDFADSGVAVVLDPGFLPEPVLLEAIKEAFYGNEPAAVGKPLNPMRRVVVSARRNDAGPGFIAFRLRDAATIGFFDEHYFFAGDRAFSYELAWRLFLAAVPSFELGEALIEKDLEPWWTISPFTSDVRILEWATRLSPLLADARRILALSPSPQSRLFIPIATVVHERRWPRLLDTISTRGNLARRSRNRNLLGTRWHMYRAFVVLADGSQAAARRLASGGGAMASFLALATVLIRPILRRISR